MKIIFMRTGYVYGGPAAAELAAGTNAVTAQEPAEQRQPGAIDGNRNVKEALGFLKDWVSALVSLQTAAIGAIGVFLGLKSSGAVAAGTQGPSVPLLVSSGLAPGWLAERTVEIQVLSGAFVCLTVGCFLVSIFCGLEVLYMLPGSAQRIPEPGKDVFSFRTLHGPTIGFWSQWHWTTFAVGLVLFGAFIVVRMLTL